MRERNTAHFGLLIAYVVPGFVALLGASFLSPGLRMWLTGPATEGPTLGGFLYVTVASISGGMVTNAVRWAVVDTTHHLTGLPRPNWTFASLHERLSAYEWLVENHYRHYQFYGNTLCGAVFAYACWRSSLSGSGNGLGWFDGAVVALFLVLGAGSRTTLERYYERVQSLLGTEWKETQMANGGQHKPETKQANGQKQTKGSADKKPPTKAGK